MVTFFSYTCKEAPLTEIEKIRATTMMRNNRIIQSLGIPTIVSMIRKTHGGRGGSTLSSDESSAITQGESSDYNPRDDQVIDEEDEEVQGSLGEETVQVHTPHHLWRAGITCIFAYFCFAITCDVMPLLFVRGIEDSQE
jgi:hypothetical protein